MRRDEECGIVATFRGRFKVSPADYKGVIQNYIPDEKERRMTQEELEAIKQREREHQEAHAGWGALHDSCLPGGCAEGGNDISKLIAEVERLRYLDGAEPPLSTVINILDATCERLGLNYALKTFPKGEATDDSANHQSYSE